MGRTGDGCFQGGLVGHARCCHGCGGGTRAFVYIERGMEGTTRTALTGVVEGRRLLFRRLRPHHVVSDRVPCGLHRRQSPVGGGGGSVGPRTFFLPPRAQVLPPPRPCRPPWSGPACAPRPLHKQKRVTIERARKRGQAPAAAGRRGAKRSGTPPPEERTRDPYKPGVMSPPLGGGLSPSTRYPPNPFARPELCGPARRWGTGKGRRTSCRCGRHPPLMTHPSAGRQSPSFPSPELGALF